MPYSEKDHKVTNVNYLNKDFSSLKNSLIEHAKTYFPNTYRDFNETSPGMMLIEMSAYVGDVLSYYIDQQYKEMMLPLAEERRNVINMANMLGYKVKAITPAYVDLKFSQIVASSGDINYKTLDMTETVIIPKGTKVTSANDTSIFFETLDVVDFTITGSAVISRHTFDSNSIVDTWKISKNVKAMSGETKTKTFKIGSPSKFMKLNINDTNVIDIIDIFDQGGNRWYEVNYLAQDKVPLETYYTASIRTTSYGGNIAGDSSIVDDVSVPYSLEYRKTSKRFITELNDDNTTSLVFGNGVLRSGQIEGSELYQLEQVGVVLPGSTTQITDAIDPFAGDYQSTLGESPNNTTLIVRYRVGGGMASNIPANDLTTHNYTGADSGDVSVTNEFPARGGSNGETIEEIRHNSRAFFASQTRCVTKEDFEARSLAMPAKFGKIAKIFVDRSTLTSVTENDLSFSQADIDKMINVLGFIQGDTGAVSDLLTQYEANANLPDGATTYGDLEFFWNLLDLDQSGNLGASDLTEISGLITKLETLKSQVQTGGSLFNAQQGNVQIHILGYNDSKNLVEVKSSNQLWINLKSYLENYRMITDDIQLLSGKVVNFGVGFSVVAHRTSNKSDVKLRCINTIINYFNIDKLQFRQPLYLSDLEYELLGLEGVRAVEWIEMTQNFNSMYHQNLSDASKPLYYYSYDSENNNIAQDGTAGYGWKYDFKSFFDGTYGGGNTVFPSTTPSVFELKNPYENVKGIVK